MCSISIQQAVRAGRGGERDRAVHCFVPATDAITKPAEMLYCSSHEMVAMIAMIAVFSPTLASHTHTIRNEQLTTRTPLSSTSMHSAVHEDTDGTGRQYKHNTRMRRQQTAATQNFQSTSDDWHCTSDTADLHKIQTQTRPRKAPAHIKTVNV